MLQTFSTVRKVAVPLDANSGTNITPLFAYTPFTLSGYRVINENLSLSNLQAIAYIYSLPVVAFPVFDLTESDSQQLLTAINLEWQNARIQLDTLVRVGLTGTYQRIASNSLTNPNPYPYKQFTLDNQLLGSGDMLAVQVRNVGYGLLQNSAGGSDVVTVSADLTTTITIEETVDNASVVANNITTTAATVVNSNVNRKGITFFNNSTQTVYIDTVSTVSTTSYTVALAVGDYYEAPAPIYTGAYYAVVASGNTAINIREYS
ncbi:MAG: hypothetical protein V7K76_26050 [Nostoc sp.]|uniref:hypothetical protein n=1 Tax=Nostoc sp. TaxID=1180 RepID=UPI002FFB67E8